jgi:hypothetical protein
MPGYDRSELIMASIKTLQRDLLEEAVIVSLVIIIFLFHFRSALIAILALPIAVVASFIPMYWLGVTSNIMSLGGLALAIGVLVDASIVMVENGYRHLSEQQEHDTTAIPDHERATILINAAKQVGPALFFSLLIIVVSFLPVFLLEAQEGRMFRPPGLDQNTCGWLVIHPCNHARSGPDGSAHPGKAPPRAQQSNIAIYPSDLSSNSSLLLTVSLAHDCGQRHFSRGHIPACFAFGQSVYASPIRRLQLVYADCASRHFHRAGESAAPRTGSNPASLPGSGKRVRHCWTLR